MFYEKKMSGSVTAEQNLYKRAFFFKGMSSQAETQRMRKSQTGRSQEKELQTEKEQQACL